MATDEKALNAYIALAIGEIAPPGFEAKPEQHGTARAGHPVPDIILEMPYGLRMIIETEYGAPAIEDAKRRIGYRFNDWSDQIRNVLAVGVPAWLRDCEPRRVVAELARGTAELEIQVVTVKSNGDASIFPDSPHHAKLRDLIQIAWLAAIPDQLTKRALSDTIDELEVARVELARELGSLPKDVRAELVDSYVGGGSVLGRNCDFGISEACGQTCEFRERCEAKISGVAGSVVGTLTNMMQLHVSLKGLGNVIPDVKPLDDDVLWVREGGDPDLGLPKMIAKEWREIEKVDYKPLTTLASEVLEDARFGHTLGVPLRSIARAVGSHLSHRISATTNAAAEIWQAMVPDRNERAAYYTKPATAELLANLTTERLVDPGEARYVEVCAGTGTLARATEENIRFRHHAKSDRPGGRAASVHARRMEEKIVLADVNQQSVTVATANLSSLEPGTAYERSSIFAVAAEGGSLNYLRPEGLLEVREEIVGGSEVKDEVLTIDGLGADICNNNDPFFRAGAESGDHNPIPETAMRCFKGLADRLQPKVANGTAGLATFMHVIEHQALKVGGVMGKVLPQSFSHTSSYSGLRRNLEGNYKDVAIISFESGKSESLSDDTSIQEVLVVATKTGEGQGDRAVTCVNLSKGIESKVEAKIIADSIAQSIATPDAFGGVKIGGGADRVVCQNGGAWRRGPVVSFGRWRRFRADRSQRD